MRLEKYIQSMILFFWLFRKVKSAYILPRPRIQFEFEGSTQPTIIYGNEDDVYDDSENRIISGVTLSFDDGRLNFVASIFIGGPPSKSTFECAAVMIALDIAVTTSSCVLRAKNPSDIQIAPNYQGCYLPNLFYSTSKKYYRVTAWAKHSHFSVRNPQNGYDIVLLLLESQIEHPYKKNFFKPIELPPDDYIPYGPAEIAGWGSETDDISQRSELLRYADVCITSYSECRSKWPYLTENIVCIKTSDYQAYGICHNDGGDPLYQYIGGKPVLIGLSTIRSSASSCESPGKAPDLFTSVSWFSDWIKKEVVNLRGFPLENDDKRYKSFGSDDAL